MLIFNKKISLNRRKNSFKKTGIVPIVPFKKRMKMNRNEPKKNENEPKKNELEKKFNSSNFFSKLKGGAYNSSTGLVVKIDAPPVRVA